VSKIVSLLAWGISALIMLPVMLYGMYFIWHKQTCNSLTTLCATY
jgi:hypothetical protein